MTQESSGSNLTPLSEELRKNINIDTNKAYIFLYSDRGSKYYPGTKVEKPPEVLEKERQQNEQVPSQIVAFISEQTQEYFKNEWGMDIQPGDEICIRKDQFIPCVRMKDGDLDAVEAFQVLGKVERKK